MSESALTIDEKLAKIAKLSAQLPAPTDAELHEACDAEIANLEARLSGKEQPTSAIGIIGIGIIGAIIGRNLR